MIDSYTSVAMPAEYTCFAGRQRYGEKLRCALCISRKVYMYLYKASTIRDGMNIGADEEGRRRMADLKTRRWGMEHGWMCCPSSSS